MECHEKFSQKMTNSEHRPNYIRNVLMAGININTIKLKNSLLPAGHSSYKPIHLGSNINTMGRCKKKCFARERWYKDTETTGDATKPNGRGKKKENFQKYGNEKMQTSSRGGLLTKIMRERKQELSKITRFKVADVSI